jgi:hypothetical protein
MFIIYQNIGLFNTRKRGFEKWGNAPEISLGMDFFRNSAQDFSEAYYRNWYLKFYGK